MTGKKLPWRMPSGPQLRFSHHPAITLADSQKCNFATVFCDVAALFEWKFGALNQQ
jgi:hypothetical protein